MRVLSTLALRGLPTPAGTPTGATPPLRPGGITMRDAPDDVPGGALCDQRVVATSITRSLVA